MAKQNNKIFDSFKKPLSQVRMMGSVLKTSINNPEEAIKARNRRNGILLSSDDFSWQVINPSDESNNRRLLERICDAYMLSKKHQPKSGPYATRGMWEGILRSQYRQMISATTNRDIARLNDILNNMFRKESRGLSMSGDMPMRFIPGSTRQYLNNYADSLMRLALFLNIRDIAKDMDNELYIFKNKVSARTLWKNICLQVNIDPRYPTVGNPFGLLYPANGSKCAIPRVAFRHLYTALRAYEFIKNEKNANILEIGGGFGGVLYYIAKISPRSQRLNLKSIDVPEINIISSYFLSKALPNIPVYFYGEKDFKSSAGKKSNIFVLPNWELRDIISGSISLTINEDSFPEMPSDTMMKYLERVADLSKYFYSINQDCGRVGQNRLSQVDTERVGLECVSYNISWMRHGYFERVYRSIKNTRQSKGEK